MPKIILAFVSVVFGSAALAGPAEEASSVVARWAEAFRASDVDAITSLYAPDAAFIGTGSRTVVTDPAGIRAYFERALLNNRPRGATLDEHVVMPLSSTAALVTGLDTTTSVRDGQVVGTPGRITFVVAERGSEWLIVHFHRSALPN
jgi:uncharacterized protein (TIGR02246 family)